MFQFRIVFRYTTALLALAFFPLGVIPLETYAAQSTTTTTTTTAASDALAEKTARLESKVEQLEKKAREQSGGWDSLVESAPWIALVVLGIVFASLWHKQVLNRQEHEAKTEQTKALFEMLSKVGWRADRPIPDLKPLLNTLRESQKSGGKP